MGGSISETLNIFLTGFIHPFRWIAFWNRVLLVCVDVTKGASEFEIQTSELPRVILFGMFSDALSDLGLGIRRDLFPS